MHLKVVIACGFLFCIINTAPRKYDENLNYVMVGSSKDDKLNSDEDKRFRSGYYPVIAHKLSYPTYGQSYTPQTSIISANIHLLEPFMLITLLLYVLSLVDRARVSSLISRNNAVRQASKNLTSFEAFDFDNHYQDHYYPYHHFKMLGGERNVTVH